MRQVLASDPQPTGTTAEDDDRLEATAEPPTLTGPWLLPADPWLVPGQPEDPPF